MHVILSDGSDERFKILCQELDQYLNDMVGGENQRSQYIQYNLLDDIHDVVLIIEGEKSVGCGGLKKYSVGVAEIKRVFVSEDYRGKKYGRIIIQELECIAKSKGYDKLILETGKPFVQAINVYRSMGYEIINNYGQYADMEDSICMEKAL